MARQSGHITMEGTIGGLEYYRRGGKYFVREKKARNKETDRKRGKEKRAIEFKGIGLMNRAFIDGLRGHTNRKFEFRVWGQATKLWFSMMKLEEEQGACRNIIVSRNKLMMRGFSVFKDDHFKGVCGFRYEVKLWPDGKAVELTIPCFDAGECIKAPGGATHYELKAGTVLLSDVVFDTEKQEYKVGDPGHHGTTHIEPGGVYSLTERKEAGFHFMMPLKEVMEPGGCVSAVTILSVRFFQRVNGKDYPLVQGDCMEVAEVF